MEKVNALLEEMLKDFNVLGDKRGGDANREVMGIVPAWEEFVDPVVIGEGGFGRVYRAVWRGALVAVKMLNTELTPYNIQLFKREAVILSRYHHPNIVLFMGASLSPPTLFIVTEFMIRGSLYDVLQDTRTALTWPTRVRMAIDAAQGINFLHNAVPPMIHRDLKTENLLV